MLKLRNPKIGEVKAENVIDNRILRKLDESGFIARAYAAQGASFKQYENTSHRQILPRTCVVIPDFTVSVDRLVTRKTSVDSSAQRGMVHCKPC